MRLLSWNVLRNGGADAEDVARLIGRHRPDLVVLAEATSALDDLASRAGGVFQRRVMTGRRHGLAAWAPGPFEATVLKLPAGTRWDLPPAIRRSLAPRHALVVRVPGLPVVAAVHLDHGQNANRRQLRRIAASAPAPSVIVGDFNAVGRTVLDGFADVGPRTGTYLVGGVLPFRLDRCLVRGLRCAGAVALEAGRSDHRPILLDLAEAG